MLAQDALQLFSPVGYPQYNGQLERSNAINKTYTHHHAVAEGHPHQWTGEDLEAARQLTNRISRPWGAKGPTPDERWAMRTPITQAERDLFAAEVTRQRQEARRVLGYAEGEVLDTEATDEVERRAIGSALEACGYLTKVEQSRPPRGKRRRRRESLERALRQQRETRLPPPAPGRPQDNALPTPSSPRVTPSPHPTPLAGQPDVAPHQLAFALPSDRIPLVVEPCSDEHNTRPPLEPRSVHGP